MVQHGAPGRWVPDRGKRRVYQVVLPILAAASIIVLFLNNYLASMPGFYSGSQNE